MVGFLQTSISEKFLLLGIVNSIAEKNSQIKYHISSEIKGIDLLSSKCYCC